MKKRRVVVWGASGKTGRALTAALSTGGFCVQGISRYPRASDGGVTWWSPQDLDQAMDGASAAWLIAPNMYPDEVELARYFSHAAARGGVMRLGYHSVLNPCDRTMPHHVRKGCAEETLQEIHDDVVIVRPSAYHQNLSPSAIAGEIAVPYRVDAPFATVDLRDVAEASAALLSQQEPPERVVELVGPERLTVFDMADRATTALGRPVTATRRSVPRDVPGDLAAMFAAYDRSGLLPLSGAGSGPMERLLGRAATTWEEHLVCAERRGSAHMTRMIDLTQ